MSMGRFEEAVSEAQQIRSLDPFSPAAAATLGRVLYFARRFPEATKEFQSALQLDPNFVSARYDLAQIYVVDGKARDAVNELQHVRAQNRSDVSLLATLAYAYGKAGQTAKARALLADIQKRLPSEHVAPADMAFLFVGLGDYDQAVDWFEKEHSERGNFLPFINTDPGLDPLRSHPRFKQLLASLHFPVFATAEIKGR
jgi:Flp pilus assembly protein TadD